MLEKTLESPMDCKEIHQSILKESVLNIHWNNWCWRWNSNTLVTWSEELTHLKRHWCWERLKAGREGDNRGWDGWMASLTQWTWVWVNFRSWWWTGRPGVLQSVGSQRVRHDWVTEMNWTEVPTWTRFSFINNQAWVKLAEEQGGMSPPCAYEPMSSFRSWPCLLWLWDVLAQCLVPSRQSVMFADRRPFIAEG